MTDSRREFLLRFAATALAAAGGGCDAVEVPDGPLAKRESPLAVYGPPPNARRRDEPRVMELGFADGKMVLDAAARVVLDEVASAMRQGPSLLAVIEGHADDRGTREYNLSLGERRAQLVRQYLIGQGVEEGRMVAMSLGRERPRDPARTKTARAANRRVVIRLDPR